ncbi:PAS domain-containing sensor histidine kinase [Ammoniphilus resinae]|uniref:PAS domain-containing sensor histidine kinase n=1 Tax=Ammoniphilus resinae TaxID=861532 RepID=UPI001AE74DFE|nr:PAS domain S-box protein [Ammoniphilus resinae]
MSWIFLWTLFKRVVETKDKLHSIVELNSALICEIDLKGFILHANPLIEDITGYTTHEVKGKPFSSFISEEDKEITGEYLEIIKQDTVSHFEATVIHCNGKHVQIGVKCIPIRIKKKVMGYYLIAKDITRRKTMEKALSESEEKYRLITENTSDFIALADPQGKILYATQSHQCIAGFQENNLSYFSVHPEDWERVKQVFKDIVVDKTPGQAEYRVPHVNGGWITFESRGMPILNDRGRVEKIVIVSRDITERKKTDELLIKSEKLSVAGQLAAGVAHEIRNPLTTLRGFVQLLQSSDKGNQKYYDIMLSELDRINLIVSEFLILSKPHLRHFDRKDVANILESTVALLDPQANMQNIRIEMNNDSNSSFVNCEENHLKQVFINLIKNGMEAMPNGGNLKITVRNVDAQQLHIEIVDEGVGVSSEQLKRLGEPFFTTKSTGTGLGLMICYKIITDHNGKIAITSEIGEGTTVNIFLPLYQEVKQEAEEKLHYVE